MQWPTLDSIMYLTLKQGITNLSQALNIVWWRGLGVWMDRERQGGWEDEQLKEL